MTRLAACQGPGTAPATAGVRSSVHSLDPTSHLAATRKTSATEGQAEESFSLSRSLQLTDEVQADKGAAADENSVLTVTRPKREEAKPKKVSLAVKEPRRVPRSFKSQPRTLNASPIRSLFHTLPPSLGRTPATTHPAGASDLGATVKTAGRMVSRSSCPA